MYQLNDDMSIYVTRGDMVFMKVSADNNGKPYTFDVGEVLRIKVYGKKNCTDVVLQKDFPVTAATQEVEMILEEEDTKIGEVINKPKDYWYEVELNPYDNPQTIIGYDEEGPCVFRLFPEGADIPEFVPDPEDVKIIDDELDMDSDRPVRNQVIARAFAQLQAGYQATHDAVAQRYATPQMYGAIGDGVSDDTEAINNCLAANARVFIPKGTYLIDPNVSLTMHDNQVLELSENTTIKAFVTDEEKYNYAITIDGVSNVTIKGGKLCGDRLEYPDSTSERGYGIYICNSKNVTVEDCEISDFRGDCIIIESYGHPYPTTTEEYDAFANTNIKIIRCNIHNALRHGITVMGVRGLFVKDTEIYDTNGKAYSCAIDAETHYEWQAMSDFRYENVRAYNCGNGVLFNQNAFKGTISGINMDLCDFFRTQIGAVGSATINRSDIGIVSIGGVDSLIVSHCNLGQCYITHTAKKVIVNKSIFECSEQYPEAFTFQYTTEETSVECEINDCVINTYASDVKDATKNLFAIQTRPINLTMNGCVFYINNPNGVKLSALNLIKVFGCKFINRFNQDGYPSAILSVSAKENYVVGNIFDTTEAHATNNDKCIIESSTGDVYFANNVGVMTEIYGVLLSFSNGDSGRTWTFMNNVFPKYPGKGQTATGVTYIDVGNVYSGTT